MVAMELVHDGDPQRPNPELTRAVVLEGANAGLLLLSCGLRSNVVRFLPALTMPDGLLAEAMERLTGLLRKLIPA
jgi:4-aminobutyrate aminotransferase/(S)-3-amino-2-methylpropionate transaminase